MIKTGILTFLSVAALAFAGATFAQTSQSPYMTNPTNSPTQQGVGASSGTSTMPSSAPSTGMGGLSR